MYTSQREKHIRAVPYLEAFGPPSSPPMITLLVVRIIKQQIDVIRNMATENPSFPAGTT